MKVAIIGRQNVGKSTFVNALAGESRFIVSEIPGTTRRDRRPLRKRQQNVSVINAGCRKQRQIVSGDIEFYSHTRATAAIRRADVVLLMLDAAAKITEVDKRLSRPRVSTHPLRHPQRTSSRGDSGPMCTWAPVEAPATTPRTPMNGIPAARSSFMSHCPSALSGGTATSIAVR